MASASITINVSDTRGGLGTKFLVERGAEAPVSDPVVERVMVGGSGTKGFSFTSPTRSSSPANDGDLRALIRYGGAPAISRQMNSLSE
jgi:hypothetical protein